jgi:hypothetical protein
VQKIFRTPIRLILVLVAAALAAGSGVAALSAAADTPHWTWKPIGGVIQKPPIWHTATLLQDGKSVLVAGGLYHHDFSDEWLNITIKSVQKDWAPGPNLSYFRAVHTATLLQDGQVLVTGGMGGSLEGGLVIGTLDACELLNQAGTAWGTAPKLLAPRALHTATLFTSGPKAGQVLVVGGGKVNWGGFSTEFPYFIIDIGFVADTDCYISGQGWVNQGKLSQHRFLHTATQLDDGRVLVVGGSDTKIVQGPTQPVVVPVPLTSCELFDPAAGWNTVASLKHSRIAHSATLLKDGRVLVTGGETGTENSLEPARSYEIYDPKKPGDGWICPTDQFPQDPSKRLQIPRALHTATLLTDGPEAGKVLIAGGDGPEADTSSELYDPVNDTWALNDDLNYPRVQHLSVRLSDGTVMAVGGTPNKAELFQPVTAQELFLRGISRPVRSPLPGN